jgi:hypothetical protein
MPLSSELGNNPEGQYCQHCTDSQGKLKSKDFVQAGIADWLKQISPNDTGTVDFMKRAGHYMKAMPAWAED